MFILCSVRISNWVGTGFQKHDKQDGGQNKIIYLHIVSKSLPKKTSQASGHRKEGLALIYIKKIQTKSPTHHWRILNIRRINGGQHVGRRVGWIGFFTFTQVSIDWIKRFRVCESKQNKISIMELGPGTKYSFAVVKKKGGSRSSIC